VGRARGDAEGATSACATLRLERSDADRGAEDLPVVCLKGELDVDAVPMVDRFLRRRLGPLYQRHTLVIDLGDVTLVDSSFIGFMVRLLGEERRGHSEVVLAHPVGRVRSHLCMVGLPNLVPVYESLEDALRAVREARAPLIPPVFGMAG